MLASKSGGLGAVHLLPLDPSIQNLHHEGRLFLGPSHIQNVRQEKELQMIGLRRDTGMILKLEALALFASSTLPDSTSFL